jgi:ribose transport system ATP-binding protein
MTTAVDAPAISVRGIGKSYGGISVLRNIDLDLVPGEIHGLVGENGAGKSTLLRILGGAVRADAGEVRFDGAAVHLGSPREAIAHGVGLISQEGALVPALTVLENVFIGRWHQRVGIRSAREDRRAFDALLKKTEFALDPDARIDRISIGAQQEVEILRALARGARVLALDEPTAVAGEREKARLLPLFRRLAEDGTTVILVSHFLEEVLGIADRISVLRDGDLVETRPADSYGPSSLVRLMVGRDVDTMYNEPATVPEDAPVRMSARGLRGGPVRGVDLDVRAGEIVGIAGLVGSGRTETLRLLFGADPRRAGTVEIDGTVLRGSSPRRAMAAGLALVPESRKDQGLVLGRSIQENIALASLGSRRLGPFVDLRHERRAVDEVVKATDIRSSQSGAPVGVLSGGNQQKTLFARWLLRRPRVLLIDEPTRGVDIAAKRQIHQLIADLARDGLAVVCVSSEVEELLGISHRVLVLRDGQVVASFPRGAPAESVMAAAFGDEGGGTR